MANFGLQLTFETVQRDLLKGQDVVVVFLHWKLISNGFQCLPSSDLQQDIDNELLSENWNKNPEFYELFYNKQEKLHILKVINLGSHMIINFARVVDETVVSITLDYEKHIGPNFQIFKDAFINRCDLESIVDKDFKVLLFEKQEQTSSKLDLDRKPTASALLADSRSRSLLTQERREYETYNLIPNPFAVGGGDLDPLGRSDGGMLVNPRSIQPGYSGPGSLPIGAVPPGARFVPFGPPDIDQSPSRPGEYRFPRQFGGPDNDHLPPPGSNDMFM